MEARFVGNSELVAQLVTENGFKAAYAIKDGAEGPRGWTNSGLPWREPRKALDFSNLTEAITDAIGDTSDGLAVTLGIAAATCLGFLAFTEIETILQVLGSAALVQFASKKLLFAEDRKQTLRQLDEFLNTKVASKELADEVKQIGKAFLPESSTPQKAEAISYTVAESKVDTPAEPSPEINSVPETENKDETSPVLPRPQSPYPYYPDFKPPTSLTPSQPYASSLSPFSGFVIGASDSCGGCSVFRQSALLGLAFDNVPMARIKHIPTPSKKGKKKPRPTQSPSQSTGRRRRGDGEEEQEPEAGQRSAAPKKRRNKPGTVALREIRKFQRTFKLLIPAAPFVRWVSC
ncbi:hypothetical protein PIB30_045249 [Stylosanthes scabra]|uniref:Uncharacterized protein n=1 Tax=Stylosanthes scabra TaxID=79078 RepID=A0ABU6XGC2_9FABA|nr:hypothetical protein [Stylosanthes scabra]